VYLPLDPAATIAELASTRLQAIFTLVMLRRKKDSMLDGKRLVELPTKHVEIEKLEFSQEEREIYQMVGPSIAYMPCVHCRSSRLKLALKLGLIGSSVLVLS